MTTTKSFLTPTTGVSLPAGPSDGQVMVWSATLGKWVAANPTGASELAYAANISGAAQFIASGSSVDVTGCAISVPPSTRPVWLAARYRWLPNGTGTGLAMMQLIETTSGSTVIAAGTAPLHGEAPTSDEVLGYPLSMETRIGPTTSTRTFKLTAACFADSGSVAGYVSNNSENYDPSWLTAVAR